MGVGRAIRPVTVAQVGWNGGERGCKGDGREEGSTDKKVRAERCVGVRRVPRGRKVH